MAHPKRTTKRPRKRELRTMLAGRTRRRLITLSQVGVGRKAVHEFTGLDHKTLRQIKNGSTKFVRRSTRDLIFAVPFNAFCNKALIDAGATQKRIAKLVQEGFTRSEIARRLSPTIKQKFLPGYASLQIGRKGRVIARTQMRVEQLYNRVMAEVA